MHINKIIKQHRRDFTALYECEHCGYQVESSGYDDAYYHNVVIPGLECPKCKRKADENYRPLSTKYPEGYQI